MTTSPNPCRGVRFPAEIIEHAVWLYHCFSLSLRDADQRPARLHRIDASAVLTGTACGRPGAGKIVSSLNSRRVVLGTRSASSQDDGTSSRPGQYVRSGTSALQGEEMGAVSGSAALIRAAAGQQTGAGYAGQR